MKIQIAQAIFLLIFTSEVWCAKNSKDYDDEDRPYEFGFVIDGQQHRHESKDINGIIMGEFGFITADGVYHVTVYATDENGSFKILSMKNIKISDRLDQPGAKLPEKLPIGNQRPVKEISTTTTTTTTVRTTTTAKAPYRFTTIPSLRDPSCSGCSLPSTTPKVPGKENKLQFQTPQFQPGYKEPPKELKPPKNPNQNIPQNDFGNPPISGNFPNSPNKNPEYQNNLQNSFGNPSKPQSPSIPNYPSSQGFANPVANGFGTPQSPQSPLNAQPPQNSLVPFEPPKKPIREIPPKVSVEQGVIKVPGRDPIPIKDKFPNMQDGLPPGITEHDMLDLLYKFNYTLGFHGHYEKGLKNGAKIGGYFVNGRDGISRVVEYIADENGYRPKVKFINLGLDSPYTPKEGTEKTFGLQGFEFEWYPV